jgi:molybdopterin-guanine dinucleotide biosynthesis protein A
MDSVFQEISASTQHGGGPMRVAGVVLCGGRSRRMGRAKAMLPFGSGEVMLTRVLRLLGQAVNPLVTVAAVGQELPTMPADVIVVRDRKPERGPLEGLLAGLTALGDQADAAFVSSCDAPLLQPALISRMIDELGSAAVAVPQLAGRHQPLAAVYRVACVAAIRRLLDADQLRPAYLFDRVPTNRVSEATLRSVDPELLSFVNVNCPDDYQTALRLAGCVIDGD